MASAASDRSPATLCETRPALLDASRMTLATRCWSWPLMLAACDARSLAACEISRTSPRLLAGDRDGRIGRPRTQQPRIGADAHQGGDYDDEERCQQLVARRAQWECFEQVDALEVFDGVAHLG